LGYLETARFLQLLPRHLSGRVPDPASSEARWERIVEGTDLTQNEARALKDLAESKEAPPKKLEGDAKSGLKKVERRVSRILMPISHLKFAAR